MTEVRTNPVIAKRVDDIDEAKEAGSFEYFVAGDNEPAGVIYLCPCGCGQIRSLDFKPHGSPSWDWDGNVEKPTLTPSVHWIGHWHGFLRNGVWELNSRS